MQQNQQARVSSSFRPPIPPSRIFRKQPSFLPFDEDGKQSGSNIAQGHNNANIGTPLAAGELGVTSAPGSVSYHRSGNNTFREGLLRLPHTEMPQHNTVSPFELQPISYDELDERLEDELDFSRMSTVSLMQLSGMMQAISKPLPVVKAPTSRPNTMLVNPAFYGWYEDELLGRVRTLPRIPAITAATKPTPTWKALLQHPAAKTMLGLVIGMAILLLLSRVIDFKTTAAVLEDHLRTPVGILHACIGGVAFALAFTLRGVRWKLFVQRISNVSMLKVIRIYWIGVLINFLLPVQGGEVTKSLLLKRVAGIPVSQSLPTVAMDKALDLMPVLVIIAIVPLIPGIHMNLTLWLVMGLIASILVALMMVVALTWWKREAAIQLINVFLRLLPKGMGVKIEGFAMGFVDSLIEGVKRPETFLPAALLTALAILCEGIFAWQESLAVGLNTMSLGIATFGYTVFAMFSVLPTPPAQIGTTEGAKTIVFTSLLGFNKDKVLAMSILSHLVGPAIMTVVGLVSLWSLGLTLSSVLNIQRDHHEDKRTKAPAHHRPGSMASGGISGASNVLRLQRPDLLRAYDLQQSIRK